MALKFTRNCKTFRDIHDLYMKTDVILLTDVFEEFSNMCFKYFGFDPKNYYTAPGHAWDALLKYSGAKLEPPVAEDMYIFQEKGIRGGYSNIHKRYSKANHKYLADFDEDMESKFLIYWDFNSMYATAMLKALPYNGFRWADEAEIRRIDQLIMEERYDEIPPCTISVDFEHIPENYPKEKIFAMCPDVFEENKIKKLAHHLYDKKDYVASSS